MVWYHSPSWQVVFIRLLRTLALNSGTVDRWYAGQQDIQTTNRNSHAVKSSCPTSFESAPVTPPCPQRRQRGSIVAGPRPRSAPFVSRLGVLLDLFPYLFPGLYRLPFRGVAEEVLMWPAVAQGSGHRSAPSLEADLSPSLRPLEPYPL